MLTIRSEELNKKSKEEALEQLKKSVSLRNQMCGNLYRSIMVDECCEIANHCINLGSDRKEVARILNKLS